ncbi:MAG: zinc ribbon domain-containing protein [Ruminococcus sp.]|nr:zinc ribbon domain-containing protein [Ruminococcus sp.]
MKVCPNCKNNIDDASVFCAVCGANVTAPQPEPQPNVEYAQPIPPQGVPYYNAAQPQPNVDPYDHTSEFDSQDIAENKLMAMLIYLLGIVGVAIALLSKNDSKYLNFHIRQGIKFVVVEAIVSLVTAVLCWTCIVPVVGGVFLLALAIVQIIAFVDVYNGKVKDAPIIRSFKFLD